MKKILFSMLLIFVLLNMVLINTFASDEIACEYVEVYGNADNYSESEIIDNGNGLYTLKMTGEVYFDTRIFVKITDESSNVIYLGQKDLTQDGEFECLFNYKNISGGKVTVYRHFDFYKITNPDDTKAELILELNDYKTENNEEGIKTFIKKYGAFFELDMKAYNDTADKTVIISSIMSKDVSTPDNFVSVVTEAMYLAFYNSTPVKSDFVDNYKSVLSEELSEKYDSISSEYISCFNEYLQGKTVSTKEELESYISDAIVYAVNNEVLDKYNEAKSKSEYISASGVQIDIDLTEGFNKVTNYEALDVILNSYDAVTDIDDIDIIRENIKEAIVIELINEAEPVDIFTILEDHISEIRLPSEVRDNYNNNKKDGSAIINALKQGGFTDAQSFIDALGDAVKPKKSASSGGGGGGTAPKPVVNEDETITVSDEIVNTPDKITDVGQTGKFNDLGTVSWAMTAINYLADRNIINGKDDGVFAPNDYVTREEFVKILVLAFDMGLSYEPCGFTDVGEEQWYYPYICSAKANNLVNGISDTEFGVGAYITRQDMSVMLYNALKSKGIEIVKKRDYESFDDEHNISSYATESVKALYEMGCINGMGEGVFDPKTTSSRAMAAQIIYNSVIN